MKADGSGFMNNLNKDEIELLINYSEKISNDDRLVNALRELLARREAVEKPVLWEISNPGEGTYYTEHKPSEGDYRHSLIVAELFTAPPLPVVPDRDLRDEFEKVFPIPRHAERCGEGYCCTEYNAWEANNFIERWKGWKACRTAMLQSQLIPGKTDFKGGVCDE